MPCPCFEAFCATATCVTNWAAQKARAAVRGTGSNFLQLVCVDEVVEQRGTASESECGLILITGKGMGNVMENRRRAREAGAEGWTWKW